MIDLDTHRIRHCGQSQFQFPRMRLLPLLIAAAFGAAAVGARAQSGPASSATSDPAATTEPSSDSGRRGDKPATATPQTLDTVTVTVTRRREPVREVPLQVSTVSAEKLQDAGASSLPDYLADQAGVNVNSGLTVGNATVTVRGVSTGPETAPTVGTYIDDVSFGSNSAYGFGGVMSLDMGLMDLHHIEVLRGPQGTLYGAGAMGGMLKYVTNEPELYDFSGSVRLGASSTREGQSGSTVGGVLNVPLQQGVAGLRISAFHDEVGGFVDSTGPIVGSDLDRRKATGGRVALLLQPTRNLRVKLTAVSQETDVAGKNLVQFNFATHQPLVNDLTRDLVVREPSKTKIELYAADVEYDFGWARLNSVTSSQKAKLAQRFDGTAIYAPLLAGAGLPVASVAADTAVDVQKKTQEFRLTSQGKSDLEWLAGVFYTDEQASNGQQLGATFPGGAPTPLLLASSIPSKYTETAVYGDVTWKFAPDLSATLGARLSRNRQTFSQNTDGLLVGGPTSRTNDSAETSSTYLATVSYALNNTSNIYFRAASGYRPGGPNVVLTNPATGALLAPTTFESDSLWSYEAGYKADLLDKTLSIESAVYHIRWDQIQQLFAASGVSVIVNGGKAEINGAELSATLRPSTSLDLNAALSFNEGELTESAPGLAPAGAGLPNSARFSASFGATYKFSAGGHAAFVGVSGRYVGERNSGFEGSPSIPNFRLPAYSLMDAQGGVDLGRYQLAAYVRNLFDKRAQLGADASGVPLGGPVGVAMARPRTVGVTLSASF
ncbi:TonB-dependent receptor [Roseateles violae]|uniref:TonB-dependent receptor n=1 Tax=Roseateles violae TaxID=3058042 RepID=A0ABT8DY99_9BURK|nr:TonB-dependent receptor [Pelomonas sp. PFR6]MDN3922156.1 TonB-dependent receptor [Pelomonas sp. PFR6]